MEILGGVNYYEYLVSNLSERGESEDRTLLLMYILHILFSKMDWGSSMNKSYLLTSACSYSPHQLFSNSFKEQQASSLEDYYY